MKLQNIIMWCNLLFCLSKILNAQCIKTRIYKGVHQRVINDSVWVGGLIGAFYILFALYPDFSALEKLFYNKKFKNLLYTNSFQINKPFSMRAISLPRKWIRVLRCVKKSSYSSYLISWGGKGEQLWGKNV